MDASRPSSLRLAAFALTAAGALAIGVGSVLPWVTVGIVGTDQLNTVTPGTDVTQGKVTLACAVVILILVIVSRVASDSARAVVAGIMIVAGALAAGVAADFLSSAASTYQAVDSGALVSKLVEATGQTTEQITQEIAQVGYTHVGAGAWVTLVGGLMVVAGGVLTVRWAARLSAAHVTDDEVDDEVGDDDQTPDDPSLD